MPRRLTARVAPLALALPLAVALALVSELRNARPAAADPLRLIAADNQGVTLELTLGNFRIESAGHGGENEGRSLLVAPGLGGHGAPGRPVIPGGSTLIALPPGARATAHLVEGDEEVRDGVRLAPGEKRGFVDDRGGLGMVPSSEPVPPIREGIWPPSPIEVGAPFTLRGQRVAAVRLLPFRYDEAAGRLWVRRRMRVRVDFSGATPGASLTGLPPAAPGGDHFWEPVLRGSVLNYAQGQAWRTAPGKPARVRPLFDAGPSPLDRSLRPARAQVFDESNPEVRIQLDSTAVYFVTFSQLTAKGYPAGVPIGEVSVHRHEFDENQVPAYETVELPIEVEDHGTIGTFDAGDKIIMYVQSWAERSGVSIAQRDWGDGDVVYATRVSRPGLRMQDRLRDGWLDQVGLTPIVSYPWTQRWEGNFGYMPFPGTAPAETLYDQWHWTLLVPYYTRNDTFPIDVNDIDQSHDISFTVAWQGRKVGVPYLTYASVHDENAIFTTIADSVLWLGKANQINTAVIPGTSFSDGGGNGFVQWGRNATGPAHPQNNAFANASLNYFEATYWRAYKAINDYLLCNSADASGIFEILATGFANTTGLRVYDVTDPADPRLLDLTGAPAVAGGLRFQDTTTPGSPRRYIVFSTPRAVSSASITPVTRRNLSTLVAGDYILITPEAFLAPAQTLASLHTAQGMNVVVSPLEAVFDEFNGGRRSAWAIKRYVRFALNQWQAKFVLLLGDGSEDPLNRFGTSGPDLVPVAKVPGPVAIADGREIVPSDGWYVWCLNGCDPDPITHEAPPIVPDLYIGRLPATTVQEATDLVGKLVTYDNITADQAWRNRLLLFSDDDFSSSVTFGDLGGSAYCRRFYEDRFQRLNETIREAIVDTAGLKRSDVEHYQLGVALAGEFVDANGCRPSETTTQDNTRASVTPALKTRLNAGRMWWNFQGHANEFVLAHENFWRNTIGEDDKDDLVNTNMPFLFSAFSCHVNAFARVGERRSITGPPIGEDLVDLTQKGAIGSFASVGYEIIPDNGSDHLNVSWARAMFVDPPHDDLLGNGDVGARVLLGESIALGFIRYVPTVQFDPTESGVALTYTLLGDPATRISIGAPQSLVTANGDTVVSGRPVALAPPRDTLHLEADLVSNVEIRTIELIELSATGTRTVPATDYTLTPPFPDTGPSGNGGRRYHLSYVTPLRPGTVRYTLRTVDRYGLTTDFAIVFQFSSQLLASGNVLAENDPVTPDVPLSLKVQLPTPITNPQTQMAVAVDSIPQTFTATQVDSIGRVWLLTWTHASYSLGTHLVELTALDSLKSAHHFRVVDPLASGNRLLQNVLAFPNPFDEEIGTTFGMYLIADAPADVVLKVFTTSGRVLYQRMEHNVAPGYHQWAWDGRDVEGDRIANGVYLFRLAAQSGSRQDGYDGRLVKLRRPRRGSTVTP